MLSIALECKAGQGSLWRPVLAILLGVGAYGWTIGIWRNAQLAAYVAIKLPLVILLTVVGNAAVNSVLAMLLGTGLSARETTRIILSSFACFAVITGSMVPVVLFFTLQLSDASNAHADGMSHASLLFGHTAIVAIAGVIANLQAFRQLLKITADSAAALKTFFCWIIGNLFVGAQVGWVLRPYVASPGIPIQFLRDNPFDGTFYESVMSSLRRLTGSETSAIILLVNILLLGLFIAWGALSAEQTKKSAIPSTQTPPP